jgi:hypothetical protein
MEKTNGGLDKEPIVIDLQPRETIQLLARKTSDAEQAQCARSWKKSSRGAGCDTTGRLAGGVLNKVGFAVGIKALF